MIAAPEVVLDYWFGAPGSAATIAARQSKLWFGKQPEKDRDISKRFTTTFNTAASGALDSWADLPRGRLALVILLDQFPHHIHRDTAQMFAQDSKSLAVSLEALTTGADRQLSMIERIFLYLPLEHAESVSMQDLSVAQYTQLVAEAAEPERKLFDGFLDYAHKHRDVIMRFGRFPHRNEILGRTSSQDEIEFLKQPGSRF
ncbi:MAG: DUF924 family protein [Thiobacillaceae bacterium]